MMFRDLNAAEVKVFKQWARENYKPSEPINELWHPVVRHECELINEEMKGFNEVLKECGL